MNSIGADCKELKKQYDDCFNVWFTEKFLKGDTNEDMCQPLFHVYKECVRNAIKNNNIDLQEVDKNVLGTDNEQKKPSS